MEVYGEPFNLFSLFLVMLMISGRSSVNVPRLVFFPDLLESLPAIYIKKKVFKVAELMDLAEKKSPKFVTSEKNGHL